MTSLVFLEPDGENRRRLVQLLFDTMPDISPVGQALDEAQLLIMCRSGCWRVAVVDLLSSTENPLQGLERLHQEYPGLPLIAISFSLERSRLTQLLSLDVRGVVASENITDELEPAIRSVLRNERYLSQSVREALADLAP